MTVLPRPAPRAPSRFRTPSIGPLILPAWAVGLSALTVSTFVVDHAVPLVWSGAPLLLTLGRVAGLLAAGQLLLQLVLAARPPALGRRYGLDRVLRAHGAVGMLRPRHHELWHAVHLLGYLAVALIVPHQVLTGADVLAHPALTAAWLG